MRLYCPNAPIVLVGTQMDLRDCEVTKEKLIKRKLVPVSTEDGERVRKEMNAFKYLECSAKTQVCIKTNCYFIFFYLKDEALSNFAFRPF